MRIDDLPMFVRLQPACLPTLEMVALIKMQRMAFSNHLVPCPEHPRRKTRRIICMIHNWWVHSDSFPLLLRTNGNSPNGTHGHIRDEKPSCPTPSEARSRQRTPSKAPRACIAIRSTRRVHPGRHIFLAVRVPGGHCT